MPAHLIDGEFQSDKYPTTPRGKVPLSVTDATAQDLLWEYAQRRRTVDAEFSDDLETALRLAGYNPPAPLKPPSVGANPTPAECFAELKPALDTIAKLVYTAPVSADGRRGLALLCGAWGFGVAAAEWQKDIQQGAREVADLIVAAMRAKEPTLSVIEGGRDGQGA